jgi:peptidoglycan/LPS O-acetylase OafA/YrhL
MEYRADIDGLRAWAVLAVLLFHLDLPWMQGGFIGVDVFFVISGYLITRNIRVGLERGRFSLKEFYARRVRRLMPSLLVTLGLTLLFTSLLAAQTHLMSASKSTLGATLSISNVLFWKQTSYFDDALKLNPVTHTWSLSLEEQFYLLYPLLLIWLTRASATSPTRRGLQRGLIALVTGSLVFSLWSTSARPAFAFFMVPSRLWEFALGGLVWTIEPTLSAWRRARARSVTLLTLGGGLIWGSATLMSEFDPFPGSLALLPCLGAALVILAKPSAEGFGQLCAHPALVRLGKLSYALYLVHWPLIVLYRHARFTLTLSPVAQVGLGLGSALGAVLLHRLVEEPLRRRVTLWGGVSLLRALMITVVLLSASSALLWRRALSPAHPALSALKLPADLDLRAFKRETYGGKGCAPPRCSQSGPALSAERGEVSAYVIGDSYALALYQGLTQQLKAERVVFWERGACEFYSLNYAGNMNKNQASCVQSKRDAFAELKAHPELPVVLGQHWHANFHEEMRYHPSSPEGVPLPPQAPQAVRSHSVEGYARFVATELIQLKQRLGLRSLTIIGGPPKFAEVFSPLDCLLSPLSPRPCDWSPLDDFTGWHRAFQTALTRHSEGHFEVMDLYEGLCAEGRCENLTPEGRLIYSDYGHLSSWGATHVVGLHRARFAEALEVELR